MRILCYLCNYSINLNLFQNIKIIFNEVDIEPFSDKHKAEIMCLQYYILQEMLMKFFNLKENDYFLKEETSDLHTHTHTHTEAS